MKTKKEKVKNAESTKSAERLKMEKEAIEVLAALDMGDFKTLRKMGWWKDKKK